MELKHRELKDREEKIKREIKELFFKPSIVSKDDADKFGEKKKENKANQKILVRSVKQTMEREKKQK